MKAGSPVPQAPGKPVPTLAQLAAAKATTFSEIRHALDQTSYGSWVSDDKLHTVTDAASAKIAAAIVGA